MSNWIYAVLRKLKGDAPNPVPGVLDLVEEDDDVEAEVVRVLSCTVCHKSKEVAEYWIALLPGAKSLEFLPGSKVGWDGVCSLKCAEAALGRFLVTARLTGNIYKEPDNGYADW